MAGKVTRLSKLAREFNVGISTIVDYLSDKGYEIESSPNTKIGEDLYTILVEEFQSEKATREKAKLAGVNREVRETVSLEKEEEAQPEAKEEKPVEEVEEAPKVEETPAVSEEEKEKSKTKEEEESPKVQVVGKIDLDSINTKTRPAKKSKKEKEEERLKREQEKDSTKGKKPKEEPKVEVEKVEKVEKVETEKVEKKVEKVEEESAEVEKPEKEEQKEIETIKAQSKQLSGPTVVGKIDLPEKREKKGISEEEKKKRKRKRIKKVSVDSETRKPHSGQPAHKKGKGPAGKKHFKAKPAVSEKDVQKEIKDTLARLSGGGKSKAAKMRRAKRDAVHLKMEEEAERKLAEEKVLKVTEFVTVSELGTMMDIPVANIISACMTLGIFASINQRLDAETLQIIAEEFGYAVDFVSAEVTESLQVEEDKPEDLIDRSPIVTVMGHVDHGKTSLLDYVRHANVIAGEAGGITQHIGAYSVEVEGGKKITFLDTPGHEAFTAMRARGAKVTDVAIIIIAADDNVMPQTKEAINHAQAAGVPMVFALNKVDRPNANPDKIRDELSQIDILLEDWGGKYQSQEISAKTGQGVPELLEKVLLEAELLELKANPEKKALGTVIESSLDKGKGYVTTVLVEGGTMKVGDVILAGCHMGKVKAMFNERGQNVKEARPSTPVSILGLNGAPNAGDKFNIMEDEREAKEIANKRLQLLREQGIRTQKHITLDEIGRRLAIGDFQELNIIVKGDVDGSIEALSDSFQKLSTEEIQVNIIHKGVGQISESDVMLASASNAIIVGFQVRPSVGARKIAENEEIDIRLYSIIYQAIDEIKSAMEGMLSAEIKEEIIGSAEVRETFKITKVGTIAGCFVTEGKIKRNAKIRLIREGIVGYSGDIGQLKRFKDDVKEVAHGYECGISFEKYNDVQVGDVIECFQSVEVERKLK